MAERRCVVVAGLPRSGTSWLAKGLSFAPGFTYYREPDNFNFVPGAEERFANLSLTAEHDDPAYRRLMTRAAAGEVATARTMRQDPGPLLRFLGGPGRALGERFPVLFFRKRDVLLKLVYANLNLAWISANLPQAPQVWLLRHPCGQFDSWKRLGWEPRPERLLENARLVADHLEPFAELIRSAGGYWEQAGALWAATVYVIHRQTRVDGAGSSSPTNGSAATWWHVVGQRDFHGQPDDPRLPSPQDPGAGRGVGLHDHPLVRRQRPRLAENGVRNADLAEIVQRRRAPQVESGAKRVIWTVSHRGEFLSHHYPSLRPNGWYKVIGQNPEALEPRARQGYVWIEVDGRPRQVWAGHFEVDL